MNHLLGSFVELLPHKRRWFIVLAAVVVIMAGIIPALAASTGPAPRSVLYVVSGAPYCNGDNVEYPYTATVPGTYMLSDWLRGNSSAESLGVGDSTTFVLTGPDTWTALQIQVWSDALEGWQTVESAPGPITCGTPPDADNDGVSDSSDLCPNTPTGEEIDLNGCAWSQKDDDGDNVTNGNDQCPNTLPLTLVNANGCPDDDGDGVQNDDDLCPNTPWGQSVDADGCPVEKPQDSDGDGVLDDKDECPDTPAGTPVDAVGCPKVGPSDSDGDGVLDDEDECPGYHDRLDTDRDEIPNGCDDTPFPPGPDMVPIPSTAVVGTFLSGTPLYAKPDINNPSTYWMGVGQSLWVYGVDASGEFYKVLLSGKTYWVPVDTMGPTYSSPWNGTPLPTGVVG